ncbi:MAG TPA: hypothetical protein VLR70_06630 [Arthrobacter sp.]|nr:hypothetical protein [Arthrobacter sp.]
MSVRDRFEVGRQELSFEHQRFSIGDGMTMPPHAGAVVSAFSMESIGALNGSSRGDGLTGVFRAGGRGFDNACLTVSLPV